MTKKPKSILICSNYGWTIYNFRLPLINYLKKRGYEIHVITQFDGYESYFSSNVDGVHDLFLSRKGINPFVDFFTFLHLVRLIRNIKPDICLFYTIKPVIYGSIVSALLNIPTISTITGLGTAFLSNKFLKKIVKILYKFSLRKSLVVFFQNQDDLELFLTNNLVTKSRAKLIPGSGIDLKKFIPSGTSISSNFTFLLVARMIKDKGIEEFIDAAKFIKKVHPDVIFNLVGPLGVENRSAIHPNYIENWTKQEVINYLGEVNNIQPYIEDSDCIVLPSYREGTSRVLLEAAAMSKPLIASNVPGCKEIVSDGINGYLCIPRDSNDLQKQMLKMLQLSKYERYEMGKQGRKKVEKFYDQNLVFEIYQNEIDKI